MPDVPDPADPLAADAVEPEPEPESSDPVLDLADLPIDVPAEDAVEQQREVDLDDDEYR
jgi:hypothetical protein